MGSPGFPSNPQPSHLELALKKACSLPRRVSWCNSGSADGAGPTCPHQTSPETRTHRAALPAQPAPARFQLKRAAGGAGVAVWPCGRVALWPGQGAKRRPSFRGSCGVPLSPASARLLRPHPPAAAAAKVTARCGHVTCSPGRCRPRDPARPKRRGALVCGLPLRSGAKTFEGCTSLLFPGAPRIAVDRDWRGGGHQGRWKPGHPLLSHPHAGRLATLGPSDRTMRLRCLTLSLSSKSRAGQALSDPRCVSLSTYGSAGFPG